MKIKMLIGTVTLEFIDADNVSVQDDKGNHFRRGCPIEEFNNGPNGDEKHQKIIEAAENLKQAVLDSLNT